MKDLKWLKPAFFLSKYKICIKGNFIKSLWNGYQFREPVGENYYWEIVGGLIYVEYVIKKLSQYSGKLTLERNKTYTIQKTQNHFLVLNKSNKPLCN